MSSSPSPSMPSGPSSIGPAPSPSNVSAAKRAKPLITVERLTVWGLPLLAVSVLLGAVSMALRLEQVRWTTASISVYVVCLIMWLASVARRPGGAGTASRPVSQAAIGELQPSSESLLFARFANWFFPLLGIVVLTAGSFLAAASRQQSWLAAGATSFTGCFLVWAGRLFLPLLWRSPGQAASYPSNYRPVLLNQWTLVGLLLLSFFILGGTLWFSTQALQLRWLTPAIAGFLIYTIVVSAQAIRAKSAEQTGSDLVWAVVPAVVLGVVVAALGTAVYSHYISWVVAAILGSCGCLATWSIQVVRALPKSATPGMFVFFIRAAVPMVLLTGLLTFLVFAVYRRELSTLKAALLGLLGGLTVWFFWKFVDSVDTDGPPHIESNWSGLGGGLGGCRFSSSLVYALCALTLAVCTGFVFLEVQRSSAPRDAAVESGTGNPAARKTADSRAPEGGKAASSQQSSAASSAADKDQAGANSGAK